jgi:hypothetical protein
VIKILKNLICKGQAEREYIFFASRGMEPYIFTKYPSDCYGYINGAHVCTFENMRIEADFLHIEHFALRIDQIGKKLGEKCLRDFAVLVELQLPHIDYISFSLYRSTSKTKNCQRKLLKLANARKTLLKTLGARDIEQNKPNNECYNVTGKWYKNEWK